MKKEGCALGVRVENRPYNPPSRKRQERLRGVVEKVMAGDEIEISTILTFKFAKTGTMVHVASDLENINALVEVLRPLSSNGVLSEGRIHELGQAFSETVRSDGTAVPKTRIYHDRPTIPRIAMGPAVTYAEVQKRLPQIENGVDHGAQRLVLAEGKGRRLVWTKACKVWRNRLVGYQSAGGKLELLTDGKLLGEVLHEGGRLSRAVIEAHRAKIDAFFELEISTMLHPRMTVLVDG